METNLFALASNVSWPGAFLVVGVCVCVVWFLKD